MAKNITARSKDYSQWYLDVIKAAELADYSPVRGCMVIRPYGYALWEAIQRDLDRRFKASGHVNAYFPLLIPVSFLEKEAQHVEGFAMESAVVTHSSLKKGEDGRLTASSLLPEPFVVRPTSETIIGHMYSQWIQSYRDLPVLINQWANVMRWEMRTRLFLRTSEFLWQEGHTAHESAEEAEEETKKMLDVYAQFAHDFLALPVVKGRKTSSEKFPGAVNTYAIEALMQDGKALQAGTSHFLGQNFAKAFDIKYLDRENQLRHCWTTSWGVSTRLIGGLIMTHSDDEGLILPPKIASVAAAIVPIYRSDDEKEQVIAYCRRLAGEICGQKRLESALQRDKNRETISIFLDDSASQKIVLDLREGRAVEKHFYWEQRGVPLRFEVGPRDVANEAFVLKIRYNNSKTFCNFAEASHSWFIAKMDEIQEAMYQKALKYREERTTDVNTYDELKEALTKGGFVRCWFKENEEAEAKIKEETKATVRCVPFEQSGETGKCIYSGEETTEKVLFALAY
ncbi:MAG: proline--tRNA ligase [Candidatus Bruticola sp.]